MANKHTNLQAVDKQGQTFSVLHTSTDSPLLPAANLQQLQQIDPKLVDWVTQQTELEAEFRRSQERRVNWFVFIERISGVIVGGLVAVIGFLIGGYLVLEGHDWAGVGICGTTLATIVTVIVTKQHSARQRNSGATAPPARRPGKSAPKK